MEKLSGDHCTHSISFSFTLVVTGIIVHMHARIKRAQLKPGRT